ncbi:MULTISPECIES: hypothetical protein [unclassified Micromonospora]|uniref:hypothetical protein n=1 Tax=unclassified Micromonospora TaxID=2617518 RepID=UPI0022B671F2|nr:MULTISPECIES: hypothetical protein [unclassified Micromonospora]MCZ7422293.1 hypothetical protein [Verrucosispora sp. WMMA2121]WBB90051.1 hypothetical protein O7597_24170 [Verrucosispora sp. WMMC514]
MRVDGRGWIGRRVGTLDVPAGRAERQHRSVLRTLGTTPARRAGGIDVRPAVAARFVVARLMVVRTDRR